MGNDFVGQEHMGVTCGISQYLVGVERSPGLFGMGAEFSPCRILPCGKIPVENFPLAGTLLANFRQGCFHHGVYGMIVYAGGWDIGGF